MAFRFRDERTRRVIVRTLAGFSAVATLSGLLTLMAFDQAPGDALAAPPQWPGSTSIERRQNRPTLLVFVHPQCSCTGATIAELAELTALPQDIVAPGITFVAARPARDPAWGQNAWIASASALPNARIVWDDKGGEAKTFGASTSGYALLYSQTGDLLFHGGVTGSRGHEGDNYGLAALVASLRHPQTAHPRNSVVFGCGLSAQAPSPLSRLLSTFTARLGWT